MNRASLETLALWTLAVACAGVIAIGCQRQEAARSSGQPSPAPNETPPPTASAPERRESGPGGTVMAPETKANAPSKGVAPPNSGPRPTPRKPFEIVGSGKDGWQPANLTAESLGQRIDEATRKLSGTKAESHLMVDNADLKGEISAKIEIQDRSLYRIEYQLPDRPNDTKLLVGKNGKRFSLTQERWRTGPAEAPPSDDTKLVSQWPQDFTYRLFQPFESDAKIWQRLLGSLAKGVGGYKTTVEQRTLPVDGRQVPFYRVLAQKTGPQAATIEMRFEGNRYVPLVVKINRKDRNGKDANVQWQAGWSFGKTIDPKGIQVPVQE